MKIKKIVIYPYFLCHLYLDNKSVIVLTNSLYFIRVSPSIDIDFAYKRSFDIYVYSYVIIFCCSYILDALSYIFLYFLSSSCNYYSNYYFFVSFVSCYIDNFNVSILDVQSDSSVFMSINSSFILSTDLSYSYCFDYSFFVSFYIPLDTSEISSYVMSSSNDDGSSLGGSSFGLSFGSGSYLSYLGPSSFGLSFGSDLGSYYGFFGPFYGLSLPYF